GITAREPTCVRYVRFRADDLDGAKLRALRLRITCDGAAVPQVDAPLGDFFCSQATQSSFANIALATDDGLVCRWPMPFKSSWRLQLDNLGDRPVHGRLGVSHAPLPGGFTDSTLYFHALWCVDHQLSAEAAK